MDAEIDLRRGVRRRIWVIVAVCAGGLALLGGAASLWGRHVERGELAELARATGGELVGLGRCLSGDAPAPRFLESVILRAGSENLRGCMDTAIDVKVGIDRLAEDLGIDAPVGLPPPSPHSGDPMEASTALCEWIASAHRQLAVLGGELDVETPPAPGCTLEPHPAKLVAGPALPVSVGADPRVSVRLEANEVLLTARAERSLDDEPRVALARRRTTWELIELPAGSDPDRHDWAGDTAIALARDGKGSTEVRVHERGAWETRARLPGLAVFDAVVTGGEIALVTRTRGRGTVYGVARSSDGGRSFPAATPLASLAEGDSPSGLFIVDTADAALLATAISGTARAVFRASRLERGATAAAATAEMSWDGDRSHELIGCRSGDSHWLLVDRRHLVWSKDGGRSWREVATLPGDRVRGAECSDTELGLLLHRDRRALAWLLCGAGGCGAPAAIRDQIQLFAVRFAGPPELWISSRGSARDVRRGQGLLFHVYEAGRERIVPRRVVEVAGAAGSVPVLDLGGELVQLHSGVDPAAY